MFVSPQQQLETIHAMMESGHRSVRVERHTLILWGLAAAALILFNPLLFTPERFPVKWQLIVASNVFITAVLAVVGFWDFRLTRRARRRRDETLSFVQRQTTKVLWLVIGLIVAINFGMNFFGGSYLFFSIALALIGMALYVYGLFSRQVLSWAGLLLIALGLASVALRVPYQTMEWLAVFTFGLGFPVLGLSLERVPVAGRFWMRAGFFMGWVTLIIVPTVAVARFSEPRVNVGDAITLEQFRASETGLVEGVVRLPAGTVIPIKVELASDILGGVGRAVIPAPLAHDVELSLRDGKLDGFYRVGGGAWRQSRYNFRVRDFDLSTVLSPQAGPSASVSVRFSVSD